MDWDAVARPFKALFVVGFAASSIGDSFYVGRWICRKYGDAAKAKFDDWVNGTGTASNRSRSRQPTDAKEVLRLVDNHDAVREAGIV